jgi:hypothetical protein
MTLTAVSASGGSVNLNNSGFLTLTTSAVQQVSYYSVALGFTLADVPSTSELTTLFERWRLDSVEVVLTPIYTMASSPLIAGNGAIGGVVHTQVDYNDYAVVAASQAGVNSMRQRPSYTTANISHGLPLYYRLKPRMAVSGYQAGFSTGFTNMAAQWIDTASQSVEHYGLKFVFEVLDTSAIVQFVNFKMEAKYNLSFTDVR